MAGDAERRITARMVLDSSGFNDSLQGVNNNLKVAQAELKNASASVGVFGKNSETLKGIQQALSQQIDLQSQKVNIYRDSIDKATEKMGSNITERDKLKASLVRANTTLAETITLYGDESNEANLVREGISNLTEQVTRQERAVETNARQINTYTTNLNNAEAELRTTQASLNNVNRDIATHESRWISAGKTLESVGTKLKTVGDKVSGAGDKILKLSAPLVGAGIASLKFADDFEDGMAAVSTVADTTQVSMDQLKEGIIELSNDTGKSVDDLSDGLYDAISSGVQTGDSIEFMAEATKAAVGGFTDTKTSVDGLTTVLNSYGLKATEVTNISNQMMVAQNLGKTTFGEMASVMGNVTPTASALGVSTKELFSSLATLTANGIKTSEAVTGMKAAMSNIIKPTKEASEAAEALGLKFDASEVASKGWMGFIQGVKDKLKDVAPEFMSASDKVALLEAKMKSGGGSTKDLAVELKNAKADMAALEKGSTSQLSAFATMFGSVEALNTVLTLTSQQGVSLYNDSMNQMSDGTNLVDDAFNKVNNTSGKNLNKTLNELKNAGIKFGETLEPILSEVTDVIASLTKKLEGMDEGTMKTITNIGLFTVGLGAFLKIGGSALSVIGGVVKVAGVLSSTFGTASVAAETAGVAVGGVGASASAAALLLNPFTIGIVAVGVAAVGINHLMSKEVIPAVDLFGNSCSTATQKAVTSYMDLDNKVGTSLLSMKANHTIVTTAIAKDTVGTFKDMGDKITAGNNKHYTDDLAALTKFYSDQGLANSSEAITTFQKMKEAHDKQSAEVSSYEGQIKGIYDKAAADHRQISEQEETEINLIKNRMEQTAITALTNSETEQSAIRTRMRVEAGNISTLEASDVIQASAKQRDETVNLANDQYTKTVNAISRQRDEGVIASDDQAKKMIASAEETKNQSIQKAEDMHKSVVDELEKQNGDIAKKLNTSDGSVKTWWNKLGDYFNTHPLEPKIALKNATSELSKLFKGDFKGWWEGSDLGKIFGNASGTDNFQGGLTTMHEKGYEVYNLPRGSKIYNHEASEDMILKTAQEVARGVLGSMTSSNNGGVTTIIVPVSLDGQVIAKVTAPYSDIESGKAVNNAGRAIGL